MAAATADAKNFVDPSTIQQDCAYGSKFKRFLRKFGRKPSDDAQDDNAEGNGTSVGAANASGASGLSTASQRRGSKQRGNSILGKSVGSRSIQNSSAPTTTTTASGIKTPSQPLQSHRQDSSVFTGQGGQGLADTLVMPTSTAPTKEMASPPPQISGLPSHEPLTPLDVAESTGTQRPKSPLTDDQSAPVRTSKGSAQGLIDYVATPLLSVNVSLASTGPGGPDKAGSKPPGDANDNHEHFDSSLPSVPATSLPQIFEPPAGVNAVDTPTAVTTAPAPTPSATVLSESSGSPARSRADTTSFDLDSTESIRKRDSVDNRTVDTGKSTKPTTLMSLETREPQGSSGLAGIAQFRHGDPPLGSSSPTSAHSPRVASANSSSAVQFVAPVGRALTLLPGANEPVEDSPYVNVPTISRPHPSNNPHPSAMPPDNASVLTLASSTAAQSIGGGAASSRGHHHTPSLGGARSIGGSLMGERRSSSDTYASVKALPPLSRRGSDESTRTGRESVAASATGINSAQAMTSSGSLSNVNLAGPGAPHDRLGIQRTPSQRTVATQLSIPLSGSSAVLGASDRRASSGSAHLLSQATPVLISSAATDVAMNKVEQDDFVSNVEGGGLSNETGQVPAITQTGPPESIDST